MYRLLIVEDEQAIAWGMAKSNPWEEWGFQVAGVCFNGEEAVEFIENGEYQVDLVLSDIRMPKMDGLALMEYMNSNHPEIKMIILSGYNDFSYMQTAIRSGVAEYLLKPTDIDEFEELFRRMKKNLDEEKDQKKQYERLKKAQLEKHLNNLLRGYGFTAEELEQTFLAEKSREYFIVILEADKKCETKEETYQVQVEMIRAVEQFKMEGLPSIFFRNYEETVVGLVRCGEGALNEDVIKDYVSRLQKLLDETLEMQVTLGFSQPCNDFRMLPECYEQARDCISQKHPAENDNKKKNAVALYIRELVDQEFCSNLMSLEYVAMKVKKNTAYISRIFKNEFDCNFSDYVTHKRLEYSKELLADPALKVYEVAEKSGWAAVSNYIKVFRRYFGESPNEYRTRIFGKVSDE